MKKIQIEDSRSFRTYPSWAEPEVTGETLTPKALIKETEAKAEITWGEDIPMLVIPPTIKSKKLPTWTHMVYAVGPTETDGKDGTELCIIWWSEFAPDSERVLAAIEWDKHARDF